MRIAASLMFHATVGKEFRDGLLTMNYIIKHPHKFLNSTVAFSMSLMQVTAALSLEIVFVLYIQTISGALDITKDFIAIQVVACLDDFTGQMIISMVKKHVSINLTLETTQDHKLYQSTQTQYDSRVKPEIVADGDKPSEEQ